MPLPSDWNPAHEAVWRENAPGTSRAINLRHPTYPYEGPNEGALPDDHSDTLIDFAATYLRKVSSAFGLNEMLGVPDIFDPGSSKFLDTVRLVWLPVYESESMPAPHDRSFWVSRYEDPKNHEGRVDRTVVILAVQSATANDLTQVLGSRLGIRIVAHVSPNASGPVKTRITGASCSIGLPGALALDVPAARAFLDTFFGNDDARSALKVQIREVAGFDDNPIFYDGLRVIGASDSRAIVDVYMTVLPLPDQPEAPAHAVTAQLLVGGGDAPELRTLEKWPLVAHAGPVLARVFTRDPASKAGLGGLIDSRPNRSPQRLLTYLDTRTLAGVTLGTFFETHLHDDLDEVQVVQSKLVDPGADEAADQVVAALCVTHPRLNWFAAISAYQHARGLQQPAVGLAPPGLLDTMRGYGLSPVHYFRFAALPLHVRYRAPIDHGGKDGKVVNAQVNFEGLQGDLIATNQAAPPLFLQLKFALADVKRSASRRQSLGIAADARWFWHEGGHVLLAASTGALQFRFAHSAGDALAAVLSDPDSALATHPRMRGLTFPWVYLNRRHDRDVFRGWSWSGRYHRPARFTTDVNSYPRKGYQSEQILSTSLFRLYRALGGDTAGAGGAPDPAQRRRAAHYTAYLIMEAIRLMPPAFLAPLETPNQFVSALIDADVGTLPAASGPLQGRVGGWAHKVVHWAFEAQGLYATTNALAVFDEPGKPPDSDVFIDDLREDSAGNFARGGYMPAPLDWQPVPNPPNPQPSPAVSPNPPNPPLWHATADAIRVVGNTVTVVEVSTRGSLPAAQVTVQVWWTDWPLNQPDPPPWNKATWKSLGTSAAPTVSPWPARTTFGPFPQSGSGVSPLPTSPSGRRLLIVATATCAADAANTDASPTLPCSTLPTPIVDLVAGDNNLGLRLHVIP